MKRELWSVIAVSVLLALVQFVSYRAMGLLEGPWRIDEAHKLSETVFLRYLLAGDLGNDEWFCNPVERSNPPVGKFLLGAGLLAQGVDLPDRPSLSATALGHDFYVPPTFPERVSEPWLYARHAGRITALVAASITGSMLFLLLTRLIGYLSGFVGWLVWSTNYITMTYGTTATFDPLLTLLIVAAALPALLDRSHPARASIVSGVLAGLATATRLTGAIAIPALVVAWLPRVRRRRILVPILTLAAAALVTTFVVDPFLWSAPHACTADHWNPLQRIVMRLRDLHNLSAMLEQRGAGEWDVSRFRFAMEYLAGDVRGLVALVPASASIFAFYRRPRTRALALWAVVVFGGLLLWMPFPWPRYLTTAAAALAVLAGCGADVFRRPPSPQPSPPETGDPA